MNKVAQECLAREAVLRRALAGDGLHLVYQPQIDLRTGRLVGAEALARWVHPTLDHIAPSRFIPLAEECGLINALSQWGLQEDCEQLALWRRQGVVVPSLSIYL
jgi:EAL domain-containing protein (putative c-di-GMP-specific phosphodiesterase class I)